jgi:hypothetical protein
VIDDDLTGPVERLEAGADSVDVLLRHRNCSISAGAPGRRSHDFQGWHPTATAACGPYVRFAG